jgi:hypothetical protein
MGSELRTLIEKMVSDLDANPLDTHPERLEEIARTVPHNILPLISLEPLEQYNCVIHNGIPAPTACRENGVRQLPCYECAAAVRTPNQRSCYMVISRRD